MSFIELVDTAYVQQGIGLATVDPVFQRIDMHCRDGLIAVTTHDCRRENPPAPGPMKLRLLTA
jgi:hypothetical protein